MYFFLNFYIYYIKFFDKNQKFGGRTGKTEEKRLITEVFLQHLLQISRDQP